MQDKFSATIGNFDGIHKGHMKLISHVLSYAQKNNIKSIGLESPHSVTIPGAINAWSKMHDDFGKLNFEELFLSAIDYAENGFPITEGVALS